MQDQQFRSDAREASSTSTSTQLHNRFLLHAGLGGLAGLFMEGALHPVDTVRTRIKANTKETVSFMTQLVKMNRVEGPFSYFKGFSCTLGGAFIVNSAYFYMYESLKHKFGQGTHFAKDTAPFAAAFVGAFLSNFISLPFDVVRTRMQLKPGTYEYRHFLDGAYKILKHEGFCKLYLGGPAFFTLTALETSLTFGFYELFYKTLNKYFPSKHDVNLPLSVFCSVSAAGLAGFLVNPLDVLVTRMQSVNTSTHGQSTLIQTCQNIYKHEGFGGFMKGVSGTVSYYAMGALLLFPTYEVLRSVFHVDLSE